MDYLLIAIKNLSNKEIQLLRKRIDKQAQKLKFFNLLYEHDEMDMSHVTMMEHMGYSEKPAGFYTLKNRLQEDVMEVRMEIEKNEVILTKEKVQSLRGLVYSRDAVTLLREMRKLERKCFELELFAELKEIYFCYMMIFRHDRKNMENYKSLLRDADYKQQSMMRMEELFYTKLLDTQDMFYYKSSFYFSEAEESLRQVEQMHHALQCKSSEFLYLSAKLTLRLNDSLKPGLAESKLVFKELVHLHKLYHNSFLIHRYPNCDIAIQCLLSKYYYLSGMTSQFEGVQKDIMEKINTLAGFKMFECTIFYFIYISLASKVNHLTIIANLQVSASNCSNPCGDLCGDIGQNTPFPAEMEINYIRVWKPFICDPGNPILYLCSWPRPISKEVVIKTAETIVVDGSPNCNTMLYDGKTEFYGNDAVVLREGFWAYASDDNFRFKAAVIGMPSNEIFCVPENYYDDGTTDYQVKTEENDGVQVNQNDVGILQNDDNSNFDYSSQIQGLGNLKAISHDHEVQNSVSNFKESPFSFIVFPNPNNTGLLNIEISGAREFPIEAKIFNSIGVNVVGLELISGSGVLDISYLIPGIYEIVLFHQDKLESQKFVVYK